MRFLKWTAFALVASAVAVLPVAIWISESWGLIAATAGAVGLGLLVFVLSRRRDAPPDSRG